MALYANICMKNHQKFWKNVWNGRYVSISIWIHIYWFKIVVFVDRVAPSTKCTPRYSRHLRFRRRKHCSPTKHKIAKHGSPCKLCGEIFYNNNLLLKHTRTVHTTTNEHGRIICKVGGCKSSLIDWPTWKKHARIIHRFDWTGYFSCGRFYFHYNIRL